jgi:hypothetical protein
LVEHAQMATLEERDRLLSSDSAVVGVTPATEAGGRGASGVWFSPACALRGHRRLGTSGRPHAQALKRISGPSVVVITS